MNEENQVSYYAIIPATVRYNKELKPAEKLLYGEITSLTNKFGYCFASNRYFARLYQVTIHTVSQWFSHLEKLGYIYIDFVPNEQNKMKERRIYLMETTPVQKNTYHVLKSTYPLYEKVQHNNKYNKDDLFLYIINKKNEIPFEFLNYIEKLEFNYNKDMLSIMQKEKIEVIKNIIYTLFNLYNSNFSNILELVDRDALINIYKISLEHKPSDFLNYYERAIINKYTNNST